MGIDYESKDKLLWDMYYDASYRVGYCLMEINKMHTSAYYLEIASNSMLYTHIQEYINFLTNSKDPHALSVIEQVIAKSPKPEKEEFLIQWNYHMAFLKRRKAYALIEEGRLKEAKAFIKTELLNDPLSKDFAQGELNYIEKQLAMR